jgi:hypothetical protein
VSARSVLEIELFYAASLSLRRVYLFCLLFRGYALAVGSSFKATTRRARRGYYSVSVSVYTRSSSSLVGPNGLYIRSRRVSIFLPSLPLISALILVYTFEVSYNVGYLIREGIVLRQFRYSSRSDLRSI